jgi:tetratricopeptide (TPR) repeat protein
MESIKNQEEPTTTQEDPSVMRDKRAIALWQQAYQAQMLGDLGNAIRLYQESIQMAPTAEAYTFLGWTYSFLNRYDEAIEECKHAIAVDPEFGNPYNDIGSYLMRLGKLDEAIPWFERAITAKRYEARHFPHANLGRVHLAKRDLLKAAREFGKALEIEPRYLFARRLLAALSAQLN